MVKPSKRQGILEAAIALLAEGGGEGLTASALAERAGVSKANVFHHFPRLDDVVVAAFESFVMDMPSMRPKEGTDLRDWLTALGAETASGVDAEPALMAAYFGFLAKARVDAQLRGRLAELAAAATVQFDATLELLAPGRFDQRERRALAELILLTGDGLALHRQLFPEQAAAQSAAWMRFADMVCSGEAAR